MSVGQEYQKAIPLYERALNLSKKVLSDDNTELGTLLLDYGNTKRLLGSFAEAEPLLRRAYEIGKGNDTFAAVNLALLDHDQGRYQDALPLLRQARDAEITRLSMFYSGLSAGSLIGSGKKVAIGSYLVDTIYRLSGGKQIGTVLEDEAFSASQIFSQSEASIAMTKFRSPPGESSARAICRLTGRPSVYQFIRAAGDN